MQFDIKNYLRVRNRIDRIQKRKINVRDVNKPKKG